MSMNYAIRKQGRVTVLDLSGRISRGEVLAFGPAGVMTLHEVVRGLVEKGQKKIVLNLRHVTYVDSSGLGELVSCMTTLQNHEGELYLCDASEHVEDLLRHTHLDVVLHYCPDEAAAVQEFSPRARNSAA